ncbi:1,4-dihydroxy-2-naphthoate octaprenyltransferase [Anaerosolibacter carboniphilus]|uniref:1,4-dihydroxy-2-naphthoate octaprenyltransferase n=1 Tax=Anaerosolibacter carboniphilus TaxID=1417629 RepID=A0A841KRV1_9FIRM|nr:1,4-dihydroxy-2-naphthoate polyprenyltransferase [Anaerosolibacter carboniphilus]MBB6216147.1 1,4-dihydroxy-2-naphthoate octaprenyltransferase [Anaerosolibacter carboniphilus]
MTIGSFLELVEIQTKVASIIPFLLGTCYAVYRFDAFNLKNFLLMFVSLFCIDMATTAINNYQDFKRANKKHGYGYESHNAMVSHNLKESTALAMIFMLLAIAILFGILLFLNTNILVLVLGVLSFGIGVLYSFGPIPISRTPFGEIFSGGFMGFIIPFIAIYIHVYDQNVVNIAMKGGMINLDINILEILFIALISLPSTVGISNIMLANNICDIEDDLENKRYTLPVFIGKGPALKVFKSLYYIGYIALVILLIIGVVPWVSVITLATFVLVNKHISTFYEKQNKKDTFIVAVKNFVVVNMTFVVTLVVALIMK